MTMFNIFEEIEETIKGMIKEQETSKWLGRLKKDVLGDEPAKQIVA